MVDARALFTGIAHDYERPAELLSFGQYGRWRRALVRALDLAPGDRALDVATGTGLIARDLRRRYGCAVVGVDLTPAMLARPPGNAAAADARALPFPDGTFDAVTFSYLLRYVDDPAGTLCELTRVLASGGMLGSIEFGVPEGRLSRAGWRAYARGVLPVLVRAFGMGWRAVGSFLGPSIERWASEWPVEKQLVAWRAAGVEPDDVISMSFGAGIVIVGRKT